MIHYIVSCEQFNVSSTFDDYDEAMSYAVGLEHAADDPNSVWFIEEHTKECACPGCKILESL